MPDSDRSETRRPPPLPLPLRSQFPNATPEERGKQRASPAKGLAARGQPLRRDGETRDDEGEGANSARPFLFSSSGGSDTSSDFSRKTGPRINLCPPTVATTPSPRLWEDARRDAAVTSVPPPNESTKEGSVWETIEGDESDGEREDARRPRRTRPKRWVEKFLGMFAPRARVKFQPKRGVSPMTSTPVRETSSVRRRSDPPDTEGTEDWRTAQSTGSPGVSPDQWETWHTESPGGLQDEVTLRQSPEASDTALVRADVHRDAQGREAPDKRKKRMSRGAEAQLDVEREAPRRGERVRKRVRMEDYEYY